MVLHADRNKNKKWNDDNIIKNKENISTTLMKRLKYLENMTDINKQNLRVEPIVSHTFDYHQVMTDFFVIK